MDLPQSVGAVGAQPGHGAPVLRCLLDAAKVLFCCGPGTMFLHARSLHAHFSTRIMAFMPFQAVHHVVTSLLLFFEYHKDQALNKNSNVIVYKQVYDPRNNYTHKLIYWYIKSYSSDFVSQTGKEMNLI